MRLYSWHRSEDTMGRFPIAPKVPWIWHRPTGGREGDEGQGWEGWEACRPGKRCQAGM